MGLGTVGSPVAQGGPPQHQPFVPTSPTLSSPTHGGSGSSPVVASYPQPQPQPQTQTQPPQGGYAPPYPSAPSEPQGYAPQFAQMQAQFAGMDVGSEGHVPAAQAAI